jgi:hypothetical protein
MGDHLNWETKNIKLFSLRHHKDEIRFSMVSTNLLIILGSDSRVMMWDLSRIDRPQTEDKKKDGITKLFIVHSGYIVNFCDII